MGPDDDLVPDQTRDDRDETWGERPGQDTEEWLLRERPPHHGD